MREVWVSVDVVTEPINSAEAKLFAKIPSTADDAVVFTLVRAAREAVEKYTGSSMAEKTLIAEWDELPDDNTVELPYGPIKSITSVVMVDEDGVAETLTTADDEYFSLGTIWKKLQINTIPLSTQRLKVTYVAGYGATGCPTLPSELKACMLKELATQYQYRENFTEDMVKQNEWQKSAAKYRRGI
jgi:uncharacterized phiE125 gp8 family phage protein